jgi:membrane associated rhomboid family serine protease
MGRNATMVQAAVTLESDAGRVRGQISQVPFLTLALIAGCVVVAVRSSLGADETVLKALLFADPGHTPLQEIAAGEVWRLVTPIFLHFGPLHLLFNMMWVWALGRQIEGRNGRWFLAGFVALVGVASNIAQYLVTGPAFGGMSGVVYGLLAYVWMRNRIDPNAGYQLHHDDVVLCTGWYLLCWTGVLGPIANWAHTAGLIGGLACGYGQAQLARRGDGPQPSPRRPSPPLLPRPEVPQTLQPLNLQQGSSQELPRWLRR